MKRTMTIGLLGAVLAVAVGFISTNAISATPFFMAGNEFGPNESAYMIGHVEYTVRGVDGQIKQYIQGDNEIVERGKDCSAQSIFDPTDTSACFNSGNGFQYIAIGNGTQTIDSGLTQLFDTDGTTEGCAGTGDACEMDRKVGTVSIDISGTDTEVSITNSGDPFSFNHAGSIEVTESGLFDDGTLDFATDNLFSIRSITGISVTSEDTLSVTWTITLS
ncbi:MAG: hypothetical protein ACREAJ_02930 [Nitrosopumilaceae archaeon]